MLTRQREALARCAGKSSVDLGPAQALSPVSVSGEAGASLEGLGFLCHSFPRGSKSSPALACLPTAQCPQEALQADGLTPSSDKSGQAGLPPRVPAYTQRGPRLPPAWAAALIPRSPEGSGNFSLPAPAALHSPHSLFSKCLPQASSHGQCTPC